MQEDVFKNFDNRLNVLEKPVKELALKYAKIFLKEEEGTIEEALERGIARAEMDLRNL